VSDPSTHPWLSGLFGDPEICAVLSPEAELQRFLKVEAAWTRALGKLSTTQDAESVARSIESMKIEPLALREGLAKDGVPIPSLVKLLKASIKNEALVHQGLTSQDVMDTSLMLALVEILAVFRARLAQLDQRLADLQSRYGGASIMAFTRMQAALETTVVVVIDRWREPLARLQNDLKEAQSACAIIQWGGPIGTRDHPQADQLASVFARNLGLKDPGSAWHTDRFVITQLVHLFTGMAIATGKIGEDIALMAASGADQIVLSGGESSAMSHKNNPVKAEALISLSVHAASLQMSLTNAARHEGFRSGRAWMLEWLTLPQLCVTVGAAVIRADHLLDSVTSIGRS